MELRKIEYKNAEEKNCILVVGTEEGSELALKQDSWHSEIRRCVFGGSNGVKTTISDGQGNEVNIDRLLNRDALVSIMQRLLGVDFLFFSFTKKAPSKNSPFLYVVSFAYDSNLRGYESRTTVKDIEVRLESNLIEAISATSKRLGELDANKEADEISRLSNNIAGCQIFLDLIDCIRNLEEVITENWQEIAEANYSPQMSMFDEKG